MRATSVAEVNPIRITLLAALLLPAAWQSPCVAADGVRHDDNFQAGHEAYEASDYAKAARLLQLAVEQHPRDAEIHLLLAKTYYESQRYDAAVASAEKAVALDPQSSLYHEWLGKVYGEKASHASMFSALSLAKKARKEFEKALELHPESTELIYDIGDYAMKQGQAETLAIVAGQGQAMAPSDPRSQFYRAVALIIRNERPDDSERLLNEYLKRAPLRSGFPPPWRVHEWLGRLYENQQNSQAAIQEYEAALKLESKNKSVREALKRLKKG